MFISFVILASLSLALGNFILTAFYNRFFHQRQDLAIARSPACAYAFIAKNHSITTLTRRGCGAFASVTMWIGFTTGICPFR